MQQADCFNSDIEQCNWFTVGLCSTSRWRSSIKFKTLGRWQVSKLRSVNWSEISVHDLLFAVSCWDLLNQFTNIHAVFEKHRNCHVLLYFQNLFWWNICTRGGDHSKQYETYVDFPHVGWEHGGGCFPLWGELWVRAGSRSGGAPRHSVHLMSQTSLTLFLR